MRKFASLMFIAALPLAAGFAISQAQAQQYDGAGSGAINSGVSSMPVTGMSGTTMSGIPDTNTIPPAGGGMIQSQPLMGGAGVPTGDITRMGQLEQQVRSLTDQLEQRDYQIRQMQDKFDRYTKDVDQRLRTIESTSPTPGAGTGATQPMSSGSTPPTPSPVQNGGSIPSSAGAPDSGTGPVSGSLTDPNGAFQPNATPQLGQINEANPANADGSITSGRPQGSGTQSAAQAYDKAFSNLQQSNYADAQVAFSDFLKTYPTHPLAANAQYWLGEAFYAQTQYSMAAKTFAKAFQEHPQGQKAPDALLKLAMTLDKMDKRKDACLTLGELRKRFGPSGPASVLRRADEEGQRMSCSAT